MSERQRISVKELEKLCWLGLDYGDCSRDELERLTLLSSDRRFAGE